MKITNDDWIRNSVEQNGQTRLYNALAGNANLLNEIGVNYQRVIAKVKPDGSVAYRLINEDGYVILGNQGIFNP